MTDAQRRAEQVVEGMLAKDEFSRWLGLEVVTVAPGSCTCRMTIRDEMVNGFGFAHGGIVSPSRTARWPVPPIRTAW